MKHGRSSVVSALAIRTRASRAMPPFHRIATLGKLFTHIVYSPVSQLQETGVQRHVSGYGDLLR